VQIVWQDVPELPVHRGHGVEFRSGDGTDDEDLFAFLGGYDWLKGTPEVVVILIRPPSKRHAAEFLQAACMTISEALCSGNLKHGNIEGKVFAWFNA
jgi:hypothetical protein